MTARVKAIFIAEKSGDTLFPISTATLEAGKGIVGDRYYTGEGEFSKQFAGSPALEVSLIEQEEIDQFKRVTKLDYTAAEFRRNIVTQHIRLNDLVDKEFYIGNVKLKGIKLCEPCAYLAARLGDEVMTQLLHKTGLRAQIVVGGDIQLLDLIREI